MKQLFAILFSMFCWLHINAAPQPIVLKKTHWEKMVKDLNYSQTTLPKKEAVPTEHSPDWWSFDPAFLRPFLFGLIIIAITFVLFIVIKNAKAPAKVKKEKSLATSIDEAEENLPDVALNNLLEQAVSTSDFKAALRIRFLMVLQALIDAKCIEWKKRKTNQQYLLELSDARIKSRFSAIVNVYDDTWYGNAPITAAIFEGVNLSMQTFNSELLANE
jgi:hypothetical protein